VTAPVGDYASWGSRVGATLVRGIVPAIVIAPLVAIGTAIGDAGLLLALVGYVFGIAASIRMLIQRGHLGYDVGDAVLGQRLVGQETGRQLGSGMTVFIRQLAHILDAIPCYVGYLWPLWDQQRQTFADKVMKTVVVKEAARPHEPVELIKNAFLFWTPVIKS
jgi:hypothetical protein